MNLPPHTLAAADQLQAWGRVNWPEPHVHGVRETLTIEGAERYDEALRLVGDEDGGVGIQCRICDTGGLPIAYYGWTSVPKNTYGVEYVDTISALMAAGIKHLDHLHPA